MASISNFIYTKEWTKSEHIKIARKGIEKEQVNINIIEK